MIVRGASWCDVVKHADGRVEFVSLTGTTVSCAQRWTIDARQPLLYLRAAAAGDGRVCAIGQGRDDGQAWATIDGAAPVALGTTHGVFPVLIFGDSLGWVAYVQRAANLYDVLRLHAHGGHVRLATRAMPPTSQGFLYVDGAGQPITQDAGRHTIPGLALPSPATDGVWVGQSASAATIALYDQGRITPLGTPGGQPPHIVESGGLYYVCSYVEGGAWLSTHRRPFAVGTPPVTPTPDPPKETPVEFEDKHTALMEAFNARFRAPVTQEGPMREWTQQLAEQFAFSFPGETWGCKSTSRGGTQSFDVMARQAGGRLWGYDLALNGGRADATLDTSPGAMDLTGQAFIPVTPKNHLGATTPGTPPAPGKPIPEAYMPWDVQVDVLTRFIAGIWPKDRVPEVTETGLTGSGTLSRGALGFLMPIQFKVTIAWMNANGQRAPVGMEWWAVAEQVVAAAVAEYRRSQPTP